MDLRPADGAETWKRSGCLGKTHIEPEQLKKFALMAGRDAVEAVNRHLGEPGEQLDPG